MPVKIFFAGAEEANKAHPTMNRLKVRYRLASFYYLRKKSPARRDVIMYDTDPKDVVYLIDSGAFTFFDSHIKFAKTEPVKWWGSHGELRRRVRRVPQQVSRPDFRLR